MDLRQGALDVYQVEALLQYERFDNLRRLFLLT